MGINWRKTGNTPTTPTTWVPRPLIRLDFMGWYMVQSKSRTPSCDQVCAKNAPIAVTCHSTAVGRCGCSEQLATSAHMYRHAVCKECCYSPDQHSYWSPLCWDSWARCISGRIPEQRERGLHSFRPAQCLQQ